MVSWRTDTLAAKLVSMASLTEGQNGEGNLGGLRPRIRIGPDLGSLCLLLLKAITILILPTVLGCSHCQKTYISHAYSERKRGRDGEGEMETCISHIHHYWVP